MSQILVLASTLTLGKGRCFMVKKLILSFVIAQFLLLCYFPVRACFVTGRLTREFPLGVPVRIADETAIIYWDANTKTEHFIRRARFETTSPDLGFLVPTPTKPTLIDVGDSVFEALRDITVPKRPPRVIPATSRPNSRSLPGPPPPVVRVLEQKKVGKYDATILAADDAKALVEWLKKHDYPANPEIEAWVAPYLKDKWVLTAYKIATTAEDGSPVSWFHTSTIRMSFKADKPFYPYREPKGKGRPVSESRLLRLFFLADRSYGAQLDSKPWQVPISHGDRLSQSEGFRLFGCMKLEEQGDARLWLTEFEDDTKVRSTASDLSFKQEYIPVIRRDSPGNYVPPSSIVRPVAPPSLVRPVPPSLVRPPVPTPIIRPVPLTPPKGRLVLPPPCHPGCFPSGTLIQTLGGNQPIEGLRVGDLVLTVGSDGTPGQATVANLFTTQNLLLEVRTDGKTLLTTQTQPLALVGGGLRIAGDLKAKDQIYTFEADKRKTVTVREVIATGRQAQVFNLILGEPVLFVAGGFLARSKPPAILTDPTLP